MLGCVIVEQVVGSFVEFVIRREEILARFTHDLNQYVSVYPVQTREVVRLIGTNKSIGPLGDNEQ